MIARHTPTGFDLLRHWLPPELVCIRKEFGRLLECDGGGIMELYHYW